MRGIVWRVEVVESEKRTEITLVTPSCAKTRPF